MKSVKDTVSVDQRRSKEFRLIGILPK